MIFNLFFIHLLTVIIKYHIQYTIALIFFASHLYENSFSGLCRIKFSQYDLYLGRVFSVEITCLDDSMDGIGHFITLLCIFHYLPLISLSSLELWTFLILENLRHGHFLCISLSTVWRHFRYVHFMQFIYLSPWIHMYSTNVEEL